MTAPADRARMGPDATDQTPEKWRAVAGYEDFYEVSSLGRVRLCGTGEDVGHRPAQGYVRVSLTRNGVRRHTKVHRLVAAAFLPPRSDAFEVNHKNGVKSDNRVSNLEWVTRSENTRHAWAMGRGPIGERHGSAKLTEEMIDEIHRMHSEGQQAREIAAHFGVHKETVGRILRGTAWTHVKVAPPPATARDGVHVGQVWKEGDRRQKHLCEVVDIGTPGSEYVFVRRVGKGSSRLSRVRVLTLLTRFVEVPRFLRLP